MANLLAATLRTMASESESGLVTMPVSQVHEVANQLDDLDFEFRKNFALLCERESQLGKAVLRLKSCAQRQEEQRKEIEVLVASLSRHPVSAEERHIASWSIGSRAIEIAKRITRQTKRERR